MSHNHFNLESAIERWKKQPSQPSPHFVDRVMMGVKALPTPKPWWKKFTFHIPQFRLVGAVAASLVIGVLVGHFWNHDTPSSAGNVASQPMVETNKRVVQFALAEPTAKSVVLVGDFNLWSKDATPLQKNADGVWEVRVPLTEGAYTYQFIVDGTHWMPDPKADAIDDGFGRKNSVVSL